MSSRQTFRPRRAVAWLLHNNLLKTKIVSHKLYQWFSTFLTDAPFVQYFGFQVPLDCSHEQNTCRLIKKQTKQNFYNGVAGRTKGLQTLNNIFRQPVTLGITILQSAEEDAESNTGQRQAKYEYDVAWYALNKHGNVRALSQGKWDVSVQRIRTNINNLTASNRATIRC